MMMMKIAAGMMLCSLLTACAGTNQLGADEAGYFNAEIKVVPMTYVLDTAQGPNEVLVVGEDGWISAKGKRVAHVVGQQIQDPSGAMLIGVLPDGTLTGPRIPPQGHFDAHNRLITEHARLRIVSDLTAPRAVVHGLEGEEHYGIGTVELQWEDGPRVNVHGHFEHFSWPANRLALMLTTLFLMKPDALAKPPA